MAAQPSFAAMVAFGVEGHGLGPASSYPQHLAFEELLCQELCLSPRPSKRVHEKLSYDV